MSDPFDTSFRAPPGVAEEVAPGVRRVIAPNPSPMTFTGTNTYLVGRREVAVIDPGPADPRHLAAIEAALDEGARITHVLVTHSHVDHSPLARELARRWQAPVLATGPTGHGMSPRMRALAAEGRLGGGEGLDHDFAPDRALADGEGIESAEWRIETVATPGHMSNHAAFALAGEADGILFTGDHVMGWATTLVSPPDGDLTAFMASLERLLEREERMYLPGHGGPVRETERLVRHIIDHRRMRERQILEALAAGPASAAELARRIYTDVDPRLLPMAARNVLAHLLDLEARGLAQAPGGTGADAAFALA